MINYCIAGVELNRCMNKSIDSFRVFSRSWTNKWSSQRSLPSNLVSKGHQLVTVSLCWIAFIYSLLHLFQYMREKYNIVILVHWLLYIYFILFNEIILFNMKLSFLVVKFQHLLCWFQIHSLAMLYRFHIDSRFLQPNLHIYLRQYVWSFNLVEIPSPLFKHEPSFAYITSMKFVSY